MSVATGPQRTISATLVMPRADIDRELARMRAEHPDEPEVLEEAPDTLRAADFASEVRCPAPGCIDHGEASHANDEDAADCAVCNNTRRVVLAVYEEWMKRRPSAEEP